MCGIAGFLVDPRAPALADPRAVLTAMGAVLRHRGPDADGQAWDGACGFAHTRLSVIDLSPAGRQPMVSEDRRYSLLFNGEIYNFHELRERFALDAKGHRFQSRTDTEVLLHLFEELGPAAFEHLNGMFAVAIWDSQQRVLHLARDPFGIKPLFTMQHAGAFWFASEIKALLEAPGFTRTPSREALHHYLGFDYIPGTLTAFEGIHELRPGQRIEIRPGETSLRPQAFFSLPQTTNVAVTEAEAAVEAHRRLQRAVERQLVADVPVGVMLSGGLDSSALAVLMAQARGNADFHTFALAFSETSFDESAYARQVADNLGTHHHEIMVTPARVPEILPQCLTAIDEPYADGAAIPTWMLAETARNFVTVLLSGEGGDELHGGYDTYAAYLARGLYRRLPSWLRRHAIAPAANLLPVSDARLSFDYRAKRFVAGAELGIPESHWFWRAVLLANAKAELLSAPGDFAPSDTFFTRAYAASQLRDPLARLMTIDLQYHLPDDLMIKNDRMTMAHGLEARVPFTDRDLVEYMVALPAAYRIRLGSRKRLLKKGLRGQLPASVLHKRKVGLELPYSSWMRGDLREFTEDALGEARLRRVGLFRPEAVRRLWGEHVAGTSDHGRALWGLVNYMHWHALYIESNSYRQQLPAYRPPRA